MEIARPRLLEAGLAVGPHLSALPAGCRSEMVVVTQAGREWSETDSRVDCFQSSTVVFAVENFVFAIAVIGSDLDGAGPAGSEFGLGQTAGRMDGGGLWSLLGCSDLMRFGCCC